MPSAAQIEWPQGNPLFEVQWRAVAESLAGNGIRGASDLVVSATANALEMQVDSGTAYYIGQEYSLGTASTFALASGGASDRWDTVYFDTATSSPGVREGTAGTSPEPPDIQGDELLLAVVYVPANATDVPDSDVLNWRAQFSNEAQEVHYDDDTGVYGINNVDGALDELQEAAQIGAYPLAIGDLASPFAPADIANVNAYPFANSDLSNSTITINAGTGLTTTSSSVGLGGNATVDIATDGVTASELADAVDLDEMRTRDNTITGQLADLGANPGTFGNIISAAIDGNSAQGTTHQYRFSLGGLSFILPTADSDGAGGIENARLLTNAPIRLHKASSVPTYTGEGATYYDQNENTIKSADSGGSYERPKARVNVDEFTADESGTVVAGNAGVIWTTHVPDGGTLECLQGHLLLSDGQPAPSGVDLIIATLDNAGGASVEGTVISGDGSTIHDDETGSPLASYANTSGTGTTVALMIDNGNFNAGSGADQDMIAGSRGEVI